MLPSDVTAAAEPHQDLPLRRQSLAEAAADALRRLILLEELAPGAPLHERELAERLGISRTPLREALRTLEIEGLIEYSATRRPKVADPSLEELRQNLVVLGALEALAGEAAAVAATDADIATVRDLHQRMVETSDSADPLAFFETDMAFHRTVIRASGNAALVETHSRLNARLWRARFISSRRRPDRVGTLRQHGEIAAALERRDGPACAQALRQHLDTAVVNIGKAFAERDAEGE